MQSKRVVRKIAPAHLADFDEQLWPINLVLLILAGFVSGIILGKSDFHATRLLYNGWFHLATLTVTVGLLGWGVVWLQGRMQRRLQLGVFLSLLAHLWLCMLSYNIYLSLVAERQPSRPDATEETPPVTLPEYHWQDQQQQVASDPTLEAPTPVETPDSAVELPQTSMEEPVPAEREPQPEPAAEQREPSPIELERAEVSAPHRSDRLAGAEISRVQRTAEQPLEQVAAPEMPDQPAEAESLAANVAPQERRQPAEDAQRPEASEQSMEPDLPQQQPLEARRPAPVAPSAESPETPLASRTARAAEATSAEADQAAPQPEAEPATQSLTPAAMELTRRENTPAERSSQPDPAADQRSDQAAPAPSAPRRSRSADQPRLDVASVAPDREQAAAEARPTPAAQPAVAPAAAEQADALSPAATEIARNDAPSGSPAELSSAAEPGAATTLPTAQAERAAAMNETPAVNADAPSVAPRGRSEAPVDAAAEAVEVAVATAAAAEPAGAAEPATTGVARAEGGSPGLTREQQFDSDLPGEGPQAPSAASAPAASQAMEPGPAPSPSAPAQIARARAGAEAPTATLPAEETALADAAGSAAPAAVEASSSAALARSAAAAPRGQVTADAGASAADIAQPVMAARAGAGTASGGGEPSIAAAGSSSPLARAVARGEANGEPAAIPELATATDGESTGAESPAIGELARAQTPGASDRPQALSGAGDERDTVAALGGVALGEARRDESMPSAGSPAGSAGLTARAPAASSGTEAIVEDAPSAGELAEGGAPESSADEPTPSEGPAGRFSAAPRVAGEVGQPGLSQSDAETGAEVATAASDDALLARSDGPARATAGSESNPSIDGATAAVAPRARTGMAGLPRDDSPVDEPAVEGESAPAAEGAGEPVLEVAQSEGRRRAAGLPVEIAAPEGPGGLAEDSPGRVGVPGIRARPESEIVHMAASRLIIEKSGGKLAADVRVQDTAVPGLRQRDRENRSEAARLHGGSAQTERAVELGLEFLARHQSPDGSWSLRHFGQGRPGYDKAGAGQMQSDTAGTGLALLAFLGAGNTHTDGKYRVVVGRALGYLLSHQKPDGDLFVPTDAKSNLNVWLYSHGIASISLCEAYGMTLDPLLRDPAQRALDFIVASQNPTEGGWRYAPRQGSDTSVSGWQLMALKSGELAGLNAPAECYDRVRHWLDGAQGQANPALYVYRPKSEQKHQRTTSRVMTAEALLMRQYLGWQRDNPYMIAGADYLRANLPKWGTPAGRERDAYYWYYATQVMFQMGGPHWQDWNARLRKLLVDSQTPSGPLAGSWDPAGPTPDRWGREGGRIYVTAMHLLMLEVYYRHLPLYDNLNASSAAE